jgi:hypothetical protein
MPQPQSQRKELFLILKKLSELDSEPRSIPDAPGVKSEHKKHLHRLYPLMSRAVGLGARDFELRQLLGTCLDVIGDEFGV